MTLPVAVVVVAVLGGMALGAAVVVLVLVLQLRAALRRQFEAFDKHLALHRPRPPAVIIDDQPAPVQLPPVVPAP